MASPRDLFDAMEAMGMGEMYKPAVLGRVLEEANPRPQGTDQAVAWIFEHSDEMEVCLPHI